MVSSAFINRKKHPAYSCKEDRKTYDVITVTDPNTGEEVGVTILNAKFQFLG